MRFWLRQAMVIGLHPGAALRAIGEVDYENARLIAGRSFRPEDATARVAVIGRLYAKQRLALRDLADGALADRQVVLNGQPFQVVGVYTAQNDFGDNHVFVPIEAFRATYHPGKRLSKIFVTVDSVVNVERVVNDLQTIPEADVVTTPEAVSTARTTLGSLAAASTYGAVLLFAIGAVLVVFVMVLSTRERVREIGTLKAIGASNAEGLTNQNAVRTIEGNLKAVKGVKGVTVDPKNGEVFVEHDATVKARDLVAAVEAAGFKARPASP